MGKANLQWIKQLTLTLTISSARALSRLFSFWPVMKTRVSQRLAKYVINSLLLCSARRDLNKYANRSPG